MPPLLVLVLAELTDLVVVLVAVLGEVVEEPWLASEALQQLAAEA